MYDKSYPRSVLHWSYVCRPLKTAERLSFKPISAVGSGNIDDLSGIISILCYISIYIEQSLMYEMQV